MSFKISNISNYLSQFLDKIKSSPLRILTDQHLYAAIGFLSFLPLARRVLSGLYYLLRSKSLNDIARLYRPSIYPGQSSWVAVTGATGGIGKAFCEIFTKLGFNIVAISRDQRKLDQLEKDLQTLNPTVQVRKVQIDFTHQWKKQDIQKIIVEKIEDLDISILVNNVGFGECYLFDELNSKKIYNTIHTNIYPQVYLTQGLLPSLLNRSNIRKTAIINLSSNLGTEVFLPYFSVYSATKSFNDHFSKSLATEYPHIDILSARPGRTKTEMNPNGKTTPEAQVTGILRSLGVQKETTGTFRSYLEANYGPKLYWLTKGFIRSGVFKVYERKYRKELRANADLPLHEKFIVSDSIA